jgi:hypothetical protein
MKNPIAYVVDFIVEITNTSTTPNSRHDFSYRFDRYTKDLIEYHTSALDFFMCLLCTLFIVVLILVEIILHSFFYLQLPDLDILCVVIPSLVYVFFLRYIHLAPEDSHPGTFLGNAHNGMLCLLVLSVSFYSLLAGVSFIVFGTLTRLYMPTYKKLLEEEYTFYLINK